MGNNRWQTFRTAYMETDIWVAVSKDRYRNGIELFTRRRIEFYRKILEEHILGSPEFKTSLVPVRLPDNAAPIVLDMCRASEAAGTGPMSAVAGAVAEFVCNDLGREYGLKEIIIENGGDIFMKLVYPATVSVYAGESVLSEKISLVVKPDETPVSICTSSGRVGHSLSFGKADACMIACRSGAMADAYATAFCNMVKSKDMVRKITEKALQKADILSVVIIMDDSVGLGGQLEFSFVK